MIRAWRQLISNTLLILGLALASCTSAAAQSYPSKPIHIVVPFSPGGITDVIGRALAQRLTEAWGQQVVVENKPGGGTGQVGTEYVAKSAPDGSTLLVTADATFVTAPHTYSKLPYDALNDFMPITALGISPQALIVHPSLPVRTVSELIALAKTKPGEINYGTFGIGSSGHLNMELFQALSGAKFQAVHYKGATPALTDVMAGHIQLMFISVGSAVPQWKADKVKLLAVGAAKRMALLPEVPTVAESGLPGYEAISWFGLFGPPGMPADVVGRINAEVRKIFADPEIKKNFLERQYFESIAGTPEQLTKYIKADEPKWRKVIHDAKVKAE